MLSKIQKKINTFDTVEKKILIFQHVSCVKLGVGHCFDANPNLDPGSVTGLA